MVRTGTENHRGYAVNVYTVDVTTSMKESALDFATQIIRSGNQYSRLLPREVWASNDLNMQARLEIQRTYVGKLGELVFLELLRHFGKAIDTTGMLDIFEGEENVDAFDFETNNHQTVDVKTGFRPIHIRLLVNMEQFINIPKDYYVAVWLNGRDVDAEGKLIDFDSITEGIVKGYADYAYLRDHVDERDFGEGPAKHLPYDGLMGIDRLINMF